MASTTMLPVSDYLAKTWHPDREYVDGELLERNVGQVDHARLQIVIAAFLFRLESELRISALTEVRVQVKPTRFRIPDICVVLGGVRDEPRLKSPAVRLHRNSVEGRHHVFNARADQRFPRFRRSSRVAHRSPSEVLLRLYSRRHAYDCRRRPGYRRSRNQAAARGDLRMTATVSAPELRTSPPARQ